MGSDDRPIYELYEMAGGHLLTGGSLTDPLNFEEREYAFRMVGFLSQVTGSILLIYDGAGQLIGTQERHATATMPGAIGGMEGPSVS